ncbi:MAG: nucleotide exchange factor GrpE [Candidatus Syntropharchaeales archaeon]|nr:nucleotide exchange factor GrpE [Candidatus Syntrophoarchaeum sp.]
MGVSEELKEELENLQNELDELNDKYLRALADFDNYKKRVEKDRVRNRELGREEVILKILNVLDDFERAFESDDKSNPILEGFRAIYEGLLKALAEFEVRPFESVGEVFDPIFHDAISTTPASDHPPHTITKEFQRGYLIGEKVLRPAKVEVAMDIDDEQT